jgi:hypothetical protein
LIYGKNHINKYPTIIYKMQNRTERDWKALEGKSKAGWRCFYLLSDDMWEMSEVLQKSRTENRALAKKIADGQEVDLAFLKQQFVELYEQANKQCECPVCFELLVKDTVNVGSCGHLTCKECYAKMTDCPICRKKYWKAN